MAVESDKKIARLTDHSITDRKNYITLVQRTSRSGTPAHNRARGQSMVLDDIEVAVLY